MTSDQTFSLWPKQSKASWIEQIKKENPNLDVFHVDRKINDAITVQAFPFFTDLENATSIYNKNESYRPWKCGISIPLLDIQVGHSQLIHALENGADYIQITCPQKLQEPLLDSLLETVQLDMLTSHWKVLNDSDEHIIKSYINKYFPTAEYFITYLENSSAPNISIDSIKFPVFNLTSWADQFIGYLRNLSIAEQPPNKLIVSIDCSHDILLNIASCRAVKLILSQLESIFELTFNPYFELTVDPQIVSENLQTNLIHLSSIALSASLSGPDFILLPSANKNLKSNDLNGLRNVIHVMQILKYESYLDCSVDPLAGSYAIENLTDQIAEQLWNAIQTNLAHD